MRNQKESNGFKRTWTVLYLTVKENIRNHALMGLLVFLPVYFISAVNMAFPGGEKGMRIEIPGDGVQSVSLTDLYTGIAVLMVGCVIAGIAGLFVIQKVKQADPRLVLVGYRPAELILTRVGFIVGVSTVVTTVSVGYMTVYYVPENIIWFIASTLMIAVTYGSIGIIVGTLINKLAGMYVMLFAPMIDLMVFQNPMFSADEIWIDYLPAHHATQIFVDSAFSKTIDTGTNLIWAIIYLVALTAIAITTFYRSTKKI